MDHHRHHRPAAGCHRHLSLGYLQQPGHAQRASRRGVERHHGSAQASSRPDPEPHRDGQGLRGAREAGLRERHQGTRRDGLRSDARPRHPPPRTTSRRPSRASSRSPRPTPQLQANQNFLQLQAELVDTEDKIQASRRFYNGGVRELNTKIKVFPNTLFVRGLGFTEREFFEVDEPAAIAEPPRVQF